MNEVEPWSTRTRDAAGSVGRRMGTLLQSFWDWYTDLGVGAWFIGLGLLVVCALGVAVIQGRSGPEPSSCHQASPYVDVITGMNQRKPLTQGEAQQLHDAAAQLAAFAQTAPAADDRRAFKDAAQVGRDARVGDVFSAGNIAGEFEGACPVGGFGS